MTPSLVLVDTSVWVDFFKRYDSILTQHLDELLALGKAVVVDPIHAEVLSGAKNPHEFTQLKDYFTALIHLPEPKNLWPRVAELRFRLRHRGHSVSLVDLIIALTAVDAETALWSHDIDFQMIQKEIPLQLYVGPTIKQRNLPN